MVTHCKYSLWHSGTGDRWRGGRDAAAAAAAPAAVPAAAAAAGAARPRRAPPPATQAGQKPAIPFF